MPSKVLTKIPSAGSMYARAVLPKKANKSATSLPSLSYELNGVKADPAKVKEYIRVCGGDVNTDTLPTLYPHMIGFPVCMELMLDKSFPYPLMGLVHVSNSVTQHRPIKLDEAMDIKCYFGELKDHDKGKIIELIAEVKVAGELVWETRSDMLTRVSTGNKAKKAAAQPAEPIKGSGIEWSLATDLGRRYGAVSGDRNPIHLYPITAKAFGFPRHIIHGMWTKAHALTEMAGELPDAFTVEVEFKLPIFLPGKVSFRRESSGKNIDFEVRDIKGQKPHMRGKITAK